MADDLLQQLMLRPDPGLQGLEYRPFDLFRFVSGDPRVARALMDEGVLPWWADQEAVLAFFRPLASATHWLDYQLWPREPFLMHLHSLAWFAALLGVVSALYRRFCETAGGAGLALLLYAVDDAHGPSVGWLANRNLVVALTCALPVLILHDRWRREAFRLGPWIGAVCLALGLLASEAAAVACAYLVAYALFLDRGTARSRCLSLAPYAMVVVSWRALYASGGYGAFRSGLYVDPLADPLAFLAAFIERFPVLAASQLALPWADLWEIYPLLSPALQPTVFGLACLVLGLFALLVREPWRESVSVRFWVAGAGLALVPMCATFPHDRLLLGPGIGVMAGLAAVLARAWQLRAERWAKPSLVAIAVLHLLLAPVFLAFRSSRVAELTHMLRRADSSIPSDPSIVQRTMVLVNPPIDPFAAYFSIYREAERRPRPRHVYWLATGVTGLSITTLDEHSLLLRPHAGFLSSSSQLMLRDARHPPRLGECIELSAASLCVTRVSAKGQPLEVVAHFEQGLLSPELLWMQWHSRGYQVFAPPAPGSSVVLEAADFGEVLLGG